MRTDDLWFEADDVPLKWCVSAPCLSLSICAGHVAETNIDVLLAQALADRPPLRLPPRRAPALPPPSPTSRALVPHVAARPFDPPQLARVGLCAPLVPLGSRPLVPLVRPRRLVLARNAPSAVFRRRTSTSHALVGALGDVPRRRRGSRCGGGRAVEGHAALEGPAVRAAARQQPGRGREGGVHGHGQGALELLFRLETSIFWRASSATSRCRPPAGARLRHVPGLDSTKLTFPHRLPLQEADYVRYGNTKRVTNLRKEQQDNLWEGVVQSAPPPSLLPPSAPLTTLDEHPLTQVVARFADDFDKFWNVASKLVPLPAPPTSSSSASRSPTPSSFATSSSDGRAPDGNAVRSVPLRVYLPEGAPVVQDVVQPVQQDGASLSLNSLSGAFCSSEYMH